MRKILVLLSLFVVFSGFTNDSIEQTQNEVNEYLGIDDAFERTETKDLHHGYPYTYYSNDYVTLSIYPDFDKVDKIQFYNTVDKDGVLRMIKHFGIDSENDVELNKMLYVGGCHGFYFNVINGVALNITRTHTFTWENEDEPEYSISVEFNQPKFMYLEQSIISEKQRLGCEI